LLGDGELEWKTIGEFFFFFQKNKDGEERYGTIGVALILLALHKIYLPVACIVN